MTSLQRTISLSKESANAFDSLRYSMRRAERNPGQLRGSGYPFEHAVQGGIANRINNDARETNRVTYDITSRPPGTIERQ